MLTTKIKDDILSKKGTILRKGLIVMQGQECFYRFFAEHCKRDGSYIAGTNVGFSSPRLAYIIKGNCRVEYENGKTLFLQPKDVWYIPKGLPYTSYWSTQDSVVFNKLEFEADDFSLKYKTMQSFRLLQAEDDFARLCEPQKEESPFGNASVFFNILNTVTPLLKQQKTESLNRILPALKYLHQQDFTAVSVKKLADMCYMSSSRFYEVFREAVGESPINYKNRIRVSYAKMLIQEGKTLDEVCEILHFSSPSFLRRMMKKFLGITPKNAKYNESI